MASKSGKDWPKVFARIRSALMRRGRSSHDADDLVQEAWLRLALCEQDKVVERPDAFMMRIAQNLSIDAYRASVSHGEEVCVDDVVIIDCSPSTEAILLAKERTARLTVCLGRLTPKARDIFLSHRLEGMTYREIAQRHGVSVSTVEKRIARATMQLAAWMEGW